MPHFSGNGMSLYFEQWGARTDPPLLLIHGIGCQLVQWPSAFIDALTAQGLRVIALDNRDVGLSAKPEHLGKADAAALLAAQAAGQPVDPPYRLEDMAGDALALLDHLGLMDAHVLGVSMGGMIAQHLAMMAPDRVRSLVSVMSSTGNPELPPPADAAADALVAVPAATDRNSLVQHQQQVWDVIGGPEHRSSEVGIGALAAVAIDRMVYPEGFARQLAAIVADGSRCERLQAITAPTLVIHGDQDPLVPLAAGEDTARSIPGARLAVVAGMGHDLPAPLIPGLVDQILGFVNGVDASRPAASNTSQGGLV